MPLIINAAIRLFAAKDVEDLALTTLKRVAQDPDDPRSNKAKSILQRKYGISKKTGMTKEQSKKLNKRIKDAIHNDRAASKRRALYEKWKKAAEAYKAAVQEVLQRDRAKLIRMKMRVNDLKEQYLESKEAHQDARRQMYRSKKNFHESMRPKNIHEE